MTSSPNRLVIRQTFPVDRERAFRAWSDPAEMSRWFSPVGFTTPLAEADLREGGRYRIGMQPPEGPTVFASGTYRSIVRPQRLVFTWAWEEGDGVHAGETLVTVEFHESDGGTEVVLTHEMLPTEEAVSMHRDGWIGCLASLGLHLASSPGASAPARA